MQSNVDNIDEWKDGQRTHSITVYCMCECACAYTTIKAWQKRAEWDRQCAECRTAKWYKIGKWAHFPKNKINGFYLSSIRNIHVVTIGAHSVAPSLSFQAEPSLIFFFAKVGDSKIWKKISFMISLFYDLWKRDLDPPTWSTARTPSWAQDPWAPLLVTQMKWIRYLEFWIFHMSVYCRSSASIVNSSAY